MLGLFMTSLAEGSLAYGFVISGSNIETKMFWYRVEYFGVVSSSLGWVLFSMHYAGRCDGLRRWQMACFCLEPAITLLLVCSNQVHGLVWPTWNVRATDQFLSLDVTFGPWYWVNVAYGYCLFLGGSILLAGVLARRRRLYVSRLAASPLE